MAILAATAVPLFANAPERRLGRAAHELVTHLRFARNLAMATRRDAGIIFHPGWGWYEVLIQDPDNPLQTNPVTNPVTGQTPFRVYLNQGDLAGVQLASSTFQGGTHVRFNRLGEPCRFVTGTPITSDGTVVLATSSETRTVRVVAETGHVRED